MTARESVEKIREAIILTKGEKMYDGGQTAVLEMPAGRMVKRTVTETLEGEKKALLERLADIEEALKVLREYPDVQKVIDILSKHTRF